MLQDDTRGRQMIVAGLRYEDEDIYLIFFPSDILYELFRCMKT